MSHQKDHEAEGSTWHMPQLPALVVCAPLLLGMLAQLMKRPKICILAAPCYGVHVTCCVPAAIAALLLPLPCRYIHREAQPPKLLQTHECINTITVNMKSTHCTPPALAVCMKSSQRASWHAFTFCQLALPCMCSCRKRSAQAECQSHQR